LFFAIAAGLLKIAQAQRYHQHAFWIVVGCTLLLTWQSALSMGATIGLFPLTGIPLSFVGRGTVAMVVNGAIIGLVLGYRGGPRGGKRIYLDAPVRRFTPDNGKRRRKGAHTVPGLD
jgi:cell division protein FtsW (lipid II flippase)